MLTYKERGSIELGTFLVCTCFIKQKAWSKSDKVVHYQAWGLLLFVAVPLPGTGAWTGALIAALLDLRLKLAVPAITAGVFLAGIIISLLTYGAAALL